MKKHKLFHSIIHAPKYALNKIQFITSIKLLHVSVPGCHPQGFFKNKVIQVQYANLDMHRPYWND